MLAISPGDDRDLAPWLEALGQAGLSAVLLREPHRSTRAMGSLVARARRCLAPGPSGQGPQVWVHQRHAKAETLDADGVHAPSGEEPRRRPFGASCHRRDEVERALESGASYVLLSPVWAPLSKNDPRPPLGLERFLAWAQSDRVLALGGVDLERASQVLASGRGVALMGALFGPPSPAQAGEALARAALLPPPAQRGLKTKTSGS